MTAEHRYAAYDDFEDYDDYEAEPQTRQPQRSRSGRAMAHAVSALAGLIGTPVALGLLSYGGLREQQLIQATLNTNRDTTAILLLAGGAILLLAIGALGAFSAAGPILGGLVWGVLPGVAALAMPDWGFRLVNLLPKGQIAYGVTDWLFIGGLLGTGFLLIGAGLSATLARRSRETAG